MPSAAKPYLVISGQSTIDIETYLKCLIKYFLNIGIKSFKFGVINGDDSK